MLVRDPNLATKFEFATLGAVCDASNTHFDPALVELVARLHAAEDLLPAGWES